jgi:hypothetical protein
VLDPILTPTRVRLQFRTESFTPLKRLGLGCFCQVSALSLSGWAQVAAMVAPDFLWRSFLGQSSSRKRSLKDKLVFHSKYIVFT